MQSEHIDHEKVSETKDSEMAENFRKAVESLKLLETDEELRKRVADRIS